MPLVPDPKNCDPSVKRAIQLLSKKLGYSGSPTFTGLTLLAKLIANELDVSILTVINSITEISTDGTLGDNSDSAVSTEKAVKTYVDTQMGSDTFELLDGGSSNTLLDTLIFSAESSVLI